MPGRLAAANMPHPGRRHGHAAPPAQPVAQRQIDVLHVAKIPFGEAAQGLEVRPRPQRGGGTGGQNAPVPSRREGTRRGVHRRAVPAHIVLSLGTTVCNLSAFAFCARAVGVALDPITVVALVPVILFAMVIPLSIAGWGLREGAAVVILPVAGVAAGDALAASVAFGLTFIMTTLPGVAAVWIKPRAAARHPG